MQHRVSSYEFSPYTPRVSTRFGTQAHPFEEIDLLPTAKVVDITYRNQCIYVISQSEQLVITSETAPEVHNLQDPYCDLSPELQRTIGNVTWPSIPDLVDIVQSLQDRSI